MYVCSAILSLSLYLLNPNFDLKFPKKCPKSISAKYQSTCVRFKLDLIRKRCPERDIIMLSACLSPIPSTYVATTYLRQSNNINMCNSLPQKQKDTLHKRE